MVRPGTTLRPATGPADMQSMRELFAEYAQSVAEPCCFAGFREELARLPRGYVWLALAEAEGAIAGCVALRELEPGTAEMKRLYVRPGYRGRGLGRALAVAAVERARDAGYRRLMLDSLPKMEEAIALYRALGFVEVPPYLAVPTPGAICFALSLRESGSRDAS